MMSEKRKRGQNFTSDEKDRLLKLLILHKDTILNKRTDGATNEAKLNAWIAVTDSFNTAGTIYRTKESLMKMWEKLKSESKMYYTASRRESSQTGGGPSIIKIDPILEQVCAILGRGCSGILSVPDSDSAEIEIIQVENLPKTFCTSYPPDTPKTVYTEVEELESSKNMEKTGEEVIQKTPLWARRRPRLSQSNERTEVISSLCDSFKEVNKKKENIEELKRQLIINEIDFKRKMYEIQLKIGEKELEIKNETLRQLKGGVADSKTSNVEQLQ